MATWMATQPCFFFPPFFFIFIFYFSTFKVDLFFFSVYLSTSA